MRLRMRASRSFLRGDRGANLLETALAFLLISLVALAAISYFGQNTTSLWDEVPASFEVDDSSPDDSGDSGGGGGGSGGSGGGGDGGGGDTIVVCDPSPCPPDP